MEREIHSIVWHSPDRYIEIIYVSGEPDRLMAAPEVAHAFADDVGLPLASSTNEALRWQRGEGVDPSSLKSISPASSSCFPQAPTTKVTLLA